MPEPDLRLLLVFLAATVGGAVNSIAGGGTLVTFPSLVALGIPPIVANATSTVALWPGSLSAMWGYRETMSGIRAWVAGLALPSAIGGFAGAMLLLWTGSDRFDAIVPWLVFAATVLFLTQRPLVELARRARRQPLLASGSPEPQAPTLAVGLYQLLVAVYGGYFGAGIGILMLAALGFMGFTHIHRMNGLKNGLALCINLAAAGTFMPSGLVAWPVAAAMAGGAIAGGYGGARLAQKVPQYRVRQAIVAIGFASWLWLLLR